MNVYFGLYTFMRLTNERVAVAFQPGFGYIVAINLKIRVCSVCFSMVHAWLVDLVCRRMHCGCRAKHDTSVCSNVRLKAFRGEVKDVFYAKHRHLQFIAVCINKFITK